MTYLIPIIVLLLVIWFISISNQLNRYQVSIAESKKTVDIVLVKRYDTISEMLKVAKSYAKHENQVFTELVQLRQGGTLTETQQAFQNQNHVLDQIRAVGEQYPELLSSHQFENLQHEIADENEQLAAAKRIVNSNIRIFNQCIVSFPSSLVASSKGLKEMDFLEEDVQNKKDISDFDYTVK